MRACSHGRSARPSGLYAARDYTIDFKELIGRGLADLNVDVRGRRVFLKPNMVEYESNTAINTNPLVVAGAALAFRAAGAASVMIGEGPGHRRDMEYLVTQTGLYEHLRENRIAFIDLNQDDVAEVPLRSRFTGLDRLALPVELLQSDFIVSMPKLKTHHWAGITASMKNLFGTVPGAVYGWPKNILHRHGIDNSIVDLNATIRPHFAIVDAVVAMEGDGPIMGRPRQLGCVVMGSDLVAVDATSARMIGLDPAQLPYLKERRPLPRTRRPRPYRPARRVFRAIRHRVRRARSLQADPAQWFLEHVAELAVAVLQGCPSAGRTKEACATRGRR